MNDGGGETAGRRRRWPRVLGATTAGLALATGVVWIERRPIATGFVDRELARRGVPARYTIETVGLTRQRLTNVVIGDPAAPDLVADWIEVSTAMGLSGPSVTGLSVGRARLRARLVEGRLSLGSLDRLMPPSTGGPFALPALSAALDDVRVRLETPAGLVGVRLSGRGRMDDGFRGQVALAADRLAAGGCTVRAPGGVFALAVAQRRPALRGPLRAAAVECGEGEAQDLTGRIEVALGEALDRWNGRASLAAAQAAGAGAVARRIEATASFGGDGRGTRGEVKASAALAGVDGRLAMRGASIGGTWRIAGEAIDFDGRVEAAQAAAARSLIDPLVRAGRGGEGTPVGPVLRRLTEAAAAMARGSRLSAALSVELRGQAGELRVADAALAAPTGARAALSGQGVRWRWPEGGLAAAGTITTGGGGLPEARVDFARAADGTITGRATAAPYAALGATLALQPAAFRLTPAGAGRLSSALTLSGPLADGRIEGLALPIDAAWTAGGALALNPRCTPVAWRSLAVSALRLGAQRLTLCPDGAALVTTGPRGVGGGARLGATRLAGAIGGSPFELAFTGARGDIARRSFALTGMATRIGTAERATRITAETLDGRIAGSAVGGRFAGAGGQVGQVPLVLSKAGGEWRFAGGRLEVTGGAEVTDGDTVAPRFRPLFSEDIGLTLSGNAITAKGTLRTPRDRSVVALVDIAHDLGSGRGNAALDVPGIAFSPKGLQPDHLTPLTFGVIAAVAGAVRGKGSIAWTPDGVTSTGRFATDGIDLAAAFGPATGIKGEIVFTDLLGLQTAAGQVATIATVNPGIAVENGTVRYRLLDSQRVAVEGGRWPFAGGELVLEPTVLDFGADQQRRMTFKVIGADAAAFLQQFDFGNLNATGVFDGELPMVFDASGGRIENGRLTARAGGSIAYVGELSERDLGTWGNVAFQALKALDYRALDLTMNGPLAGEMVTAIRFSGVSQGKGTKSNFLLRRIARLPFVFNVTVRAPFRQLIDSVQSFYDPSRLIQRNLPALIEEQRRRTAPAVPVQPIQPPESETVR